MAAAISRRTLARTVTKKLLEGGPQQQTHWIRALAAFLVSEGRVGEADLILNDIAHELYAQNGQLLVQVTSARALTDELRAQLAAVLKEATSAKNVSLEESVDPSLLGGLIAHTPDAVLDTSVHSRLTQLAAIK